MSPLRASRLAAASTEIIGTLAVLVGVFALYELTSSQILKIPGYVVMLGFDAIQNNVLPGVGGITFWTLFAGYLVVVSVLVGSAIHRVRARRASR